MTFVEKMKVGVLEVDRKHKIVLSNEISHIPYRIHFEVNLLGEAVRKPLVNDGSELVFLLNHKDAIEDSCVRERKKNNQAGRPSTRLGQQVPRTFTNLP
jgi:hypothetical protein